MKQLKGGYVWKIAASYWFSKEKYQAFGLLVVIVTLNLSIVMINVLLNSWQGNFYNQLQQYRFDLFLHSLLQFGVMAASFIFISGVSMYLQMLLQIRWRRYITDRYITDWLMSKTYYRMGLSGQDETDNPDQRISEDIGLFVYYTLSLSLDLLRHVAAMISFIIILWHLSGTLTIPLGEYDLAIPGYLVWAVVIYCTLGTWITVKTGKPLVALNFVHQRYEADFRFSLVRLREHGESIALYDGEKQEKAHFIAGFNRIMHNFLSIILVNQRLVWLTAAYNKLSFIFSFLVAAPRYFNRQIQLGDMFEISGAYWYVHAGLSFVVESVKIFAEWRAVIDRLNGFAEKMQETRRLDLKGALRRHEHRPDVSIRKLSLYRPDGGLLLASASLAINPGERLFVMGPSGCGKSVLFRAIAGIWPYYKGEVRLPEGQNIMFVPQRSYIPIGALRDALLYPSGAGSRNVKKLEDIMEACHLQNLAKELDSEDDWGQRLSPGEQQRIAFARVLLHRPEWLFLDEATAAIDEKTENALYSMLLKSLPGTTVVSIGHRQSLQRFHTAKLVLDGCGNWQLVRG